MFTWIPIHRETIKKIVTEPVSQSELITALREMEAASLKVISLSDKDADGQTIPLREIDPFTFFANFNRGITDEHRQNCWATLKKRWSLIIRRSRRLPWYSCRVKYEITFLFICFRTGAGAREDIVDTSYSSR